MRSANHALSILTAIAASVVFASPATADPVIDQQTVVDPVWGYQSAGDVTRTTPMASSFTAGLTGALTQVDLKFCCKQNLNPQDLTIGIYAITGGLPGGSALASEMPSSATLSALPISVGGAGMANVGTLSVLFTSPAQVTAGTSYAIVTSVDRSSGSNYRWHVEAAPTGNQTFFLSGGGDWEIANFPVGAYTTWVDTSLATGGGGGGSSNGGNVGGGSSTLDETQWQLRFISNGTNVGSLVSPGGALWMELPRLVSTERTGERFLGWATSPDFPVMVADKQVAAGHGVIDDFFNGERMIFIPVGGSALISGDNQLYAIWA